jgi:hypothetical protein
VVLDSKVIREVVVRPATEPEHAVVGLLAEELEQGPGLLQLDVDLGYMASPRIGQWAEQGVYIIARPWPGGGALFTKHDFTFDFVHGTVTCPGGQSVPMRPGRTAQFPARACDVCPQRTQCTTAKPWAGPDPDNSRGGAVPAQTACQAQDQAQSGGLAQTDGGGACHGPSVGPSRTVRPLQRAAQEPV